MKRKKLRRDDLVPHLINLMLHPKGSSYEEVLKEPTINGLEWYQYYTWTDRDVQTFKSVFIDTLVNNCTPKFTKSMAEIEWGWFYFMYGLKVVNDEKV